MLKIGQIGIGHNHSDKIKSIQRHPELFQLVGYAEENEEWVARRGERPHFIDVPRMSVDEIIEKSFNTLRENSLALCRYIRCVCPDRMHIAVIGKTSYEYITAMTGALVSGNVFVPFAPNTTVEEGVNLFEGFLAIGKFAFDFV